MLKVVQRFLCYTSPKQRVSIDLGKVNIHTSTMTNLQNQDKTGEYKCEKCGEIYVTEKVFEIHMTQYGFAVILNNS